MSCLRSPLARFSSSILLLFLLAFVLVLSREALLSAPVDETKVVPILPPPVGDDGGPGRDPPEGDSVGAALDSSLLWAEQASSKASPENAWKEHNQRTLKALHSCVGTHRSCAPNQLKVVILQDNDYRRAFVGTPGGEKIWSRSVLRAFDQLGYSYLFAAERHLVASFYSMFPELIQATIMNKEVLESCWENASGDCLKTNGNPLGLPIEHLFCPEFFGHNGGNPLGAQWSLSPEPFTHQPIRYLGYSIEDECTLTPIVPQAQRLSRVWVLAKQFHYFTSDRFPYSADIFVKASKALNIEFVGAYDLEGTSGPDFPGVRNLGRDGHALPKDVFEDEVRKSLAIVGVFDPVISPTPWYGLCWGLPFINPGDYRYDASGALEHISDSQHEFAAREGEPHVYNVNRADDDGFIDALRRALASPQERFIPPRMTEHALRDRIEAWVDTDLEALLDDVLRQDASGDLAKQLRDKNVFRSNNVRP